MEKYTMDIYAEKGAKIRFINDNGFDGEPESACEYLKPNGVYTVDYIDVGGWHSSVYLKEVPGIGFNTVMFEDVEED